MSTGVGRAGSTRLRTRCMSRCLGLGVCGRPLGIIHPRRPAKKASIDDGSGPPAALYITQKV
jgi:hypothetical protein